MKLINTKTHGVLDYVVSIILIVSPWIFGFANTENNAAKWILVILGVSSILYSLITNYELSISKIISLKLHLSLDTLSGILLAASPWIFGFAKEVFVPHLILGILEICAVIMTKATVASNYKNPVHSPAL